MQVQAGSKPGRVVLLSVRPLTRAQVLPISQVSSVASCIHHIACLLPLENVLNLSPPARWQEERDRQDAIQSRITTRRQDDEQDMERSRSSVAYKKEKKSLQALHEQWTAGDILQGWAEYRGYGRRTVSRGSQNTDERV